MEAPTWPQRRRHLCCSIADVHTREYESPVADPHVVADTDGIPSHKAAHHSVQQTAVGVCSQVGQRVILRVRSYVWCQHAVLSNIDLSPKVASVADCCPVAQSDGSAEPTTFSDMILPAELDKAQAYSVSCYHGSIAKPLELHSCAAPARDRDHISRICFTLPSNHCQRTNDLRLNAYVTRIQLRDWLRMLAIGLGPQRL